MRENEPPHAHKTVSKYYRLTFPHHSSIPKRDAPNENSAKTYMKISNGCGKMNLHVRKKPCQSTTGSHSRIIYPKRDAPNENPYENTKWKNLRCGKMDLHTQKKAVLKYYRLVFPYHLSQNAKPRTENPAKTYMRN